MNAAWWTLLGILLVAGMYVYLVWTAVPDPTDRPASQDDDRH